MRCSVALVSSVLLLAACSGDEDGSALIGPEGGSVALNEVRLEVPAGALSAPQTLRISARSDTSGLVLPGEPLSAGYTFEPDGIRFSKPLLVSFDVSGEDAVIAWSSEGDTSVLEALDTVRSGARLTANVRHFSTGAVVQRASGVTDAGVPVDAAVQDAGVGDAALPLDAATPADAGVEMDAAPDPDTGVEPDATVEPDTGVPQDATVEPDATVDAGPADSGLVDASILPSSLPTADACQTVTTPLSVTAGSAASWRMLSDFEISQTEVDVPYAGASVDPSTGVLTFAPTGFMSGYSRSTGVEATLTSGQTVRRTWSFIAGSVASYAISEGGGPPIFSTATVPNVSQSNPGAFAPLNVAMPLSQHPCTIRFALGGFLCSGANDASVFMSIDSQGNLYVSDPGFVPLVSPGTYCLAVNAEWGTQGLILDTGIYSVTVVP